MTGIRTQGLAQAAPGPRFRRAAKLVKPAEFKEVFRKSEASTDALFRILWRIGGRSGSRLGMAVSRKVERRAVGRNRIKRIVRESFRHWRAATSAPPCDIVVLPRQAAAEAGNAELRRSLERHWQRIGRAAAQTPRPATRKVN